MRLKVFCFHSRKTKEETDPQCLQWNRKVLESSCTHTQIHTKPLGLSQLQGRSVIVMEKLRTHWLMYQSYDNPPTVTVSSVLRHDCWPTVFSEVINTVSIWSLSLHYAVICCERSEPHRLPKSETSIVPLIKDIRHTIIMFIILENFTKLSRRVTTLCCFCSSFKSVEIQNEDTEMWLQSITINKKHVRLFVRDVKVHLWRTESVSWADASFCGTTVTKLKVS